MELQWSFRPCLVSSSLVDRSADRRAFATSIPKFSAFSSSGVLSSSFEGSKLASRARWPARALRRQQGVVVAGFLPVDPWSPNVDSQSLASQLFAVSLLPYLGFLYYITKSKTAPKLTLFGFYFLLVFVGATIPAGIYAKVHYGTSLSNVDWLHGGAEFFLTLTNLFIVVGLRQALRAGRKENEEAEVEEKDTVGSTK